MLVLQHKHQVKLMNQNVYKVALDPRWRNHIHRSQIIIVHNDRRNHRLDQHSDIYNIIPKTLSFLQYEKKTTLMNILNVWERLTASVTTLPFKVMFHSRIKELQRNIYLRVRFLGSNKTITWHQHLGPAPPPRPWTWTRPWTFPLLYIALSSGRRNLLLGPFYTVYSTLPYHTILWHTPLWHGLAMSYPEHCLPDRCLPWKLKKWGKYTTVGSIA